MEVRHANPWPYIAAAVVLMFLVLGWYAWQGRAAPGEAVRTAAGAMPDLRPRLPEGPHMPSAPIPRPK